MNGLKQRKAFTIVEMVIVIAVIAILATVLIPTLSGVITKANVSADQQLAASLNKQLAIWEVDNKREIKNESDLREAIDAIHETGYYDNLTAKATNKGYHFWYNATDKQLVVGRYEDLMKADTPNNGGARAWENGVNTLMIGPAFNVPTLQNQQGRSGEGEYIFSPANPRSLLINGKNFFLIGNGGSEMLDAIVSLEQNCNASNYATVLEALENGTYDKKNVEIGKKILERLKTIALVSDYGMFVAFDNAPIEYVYIVPGTTTIGSMSNYDVDKSRITSIEVPDGVAIGEFSMNGYTRVDGNGDGNYYGSTELHINATFEEVIDEEKPLICANSTNCVIVLSDGSRYIVEGNQLFMLPNTENAVHTLGYNNPVTGLEILTRDSYANVIDGQKSVYVPYDKGSVTLYANILDENPSSEAVTWSIVDVEGQDSSLIEIDQNGKVSFVKMPSNGVYEATVRATAIAGGAYADIKVCLVVVNDMSVTVNGGVVDLRPDTPSAEISFTGDTYDFDFVVGDFSTNYTGYTCDTTVRYEYDQSIFTIANGKLTLKKDGQGKITEGETVVTIKVGPEGKPYLTEKVTVKVVDNSAEPLVPALPYVNEFTYRVGNGNAVTLGTLLKSDDAPENFELKIKDKGAANGSTLPDIGTVPGSSFNATYTTNADWTKSTIKFTGVGIATIVIDGVETLTLEVVNGTNYTEGKTLPTSASTHIVLLGNVKITSTLSLNNKCLFGNGFVIDATEASNTAIGIITLNNGAMLDNAIVTGAIYTTYQATSGNGQTWSTSLVFSSNGSIISNCYLSNTKAPVRVGSGTTTITNSTISGGCYANIDVRSGSELVLEDVTLINQVGGTTPSKNALGLGVVVHENAASASVIIKGNLTQYNAIGNNDKNYMAAQDIKDYFGYLGSADPYSVGGVNHVDAGIISLSGDVGDFVDCTEADESVRNTHVNKDVSGGRYLYHLSASAGPDAYNATYNYENSWAQNNYVPNAQGDIPPTYSTVLTTTKPAEGTKEYCYLDGSTIKIGFESGGSKTLTFSSGVFNITDSLGQKLDLKSITLNGTAISDTYTFSKAGSYTLKVSVVANGKTYTYTLSVNVVITSYKTASISLSSTTTTITGSSSKDYYVVFDILAGVTINDVDADGNARTVTINNTLPSGWTIALDDTGYIVTVTTNWLNASGEYTTLKITASNSGTGDPQNWTLTCDGNKGCPANALHSCYQKAKNKTVAPTATFVYYGFNGQASNSVKLTSSTTMGSPKHTVSDCVTPDTLVTLVDGTQKEIQYVTYEDMLLVWNHFTGEYEAVPSAIIFNHGYDYNTVIKLDFSDGTQVKIINSHQFLDADSKQYVNVTAESVAELVGHNFVKQERDSYTTVALESYEITKEYIEAYGIISAVHYNILVEGMFSTDFMKQDYDLFNYFTIGEGMVYDAEQMQEDIEKYGLYTYEDFAEHLTYEQFVGFNVQYFKIAVGKGNYTYEGILELIDAYLNNAELN